LLPDSSCLTYYTDRNGGETIRASDREGCDQKTPFEFYIQSEEKTDEKGERTRSAVFVNTILKNFDTTISAYNQNPVVYVSKTDETESTVTHRRIE
jgi:hypothetical protein